MEPVIGAKRSALTTFKRDPSQTNKTALRVARNKAQQTARHCSKQLLATALPEHTDIV